MSNSYEASDYAGAQGKYLQCYYGYEETDENGDWLFIAKQGERIIATYTAEELDLGRGIDKWNCSSVLMAGMAKLFDSYQLIPAVHHDE